MKAYKGFNRDMTCRGFKFEEGKEYEQSGEIKVCENGFHACERPLDCFAYYSPGESVYHEVELNGEISKANDDTKIASRKIKIGAQLNIAGLVKAQFEYVKENTTTENTDPKTANAGSYGAANAGSYGAANAGDCGAANAGDYGAANAGSYGAANAGHCGAANAGDYGAANAGYRGAANAGDCGAANAGDYGAANAGSYGAANAGHCGAANAGDYGAANAGNCGAANAGNCGAANAGDYGAAISRGSSAVGENGVALVRGESSYGNKVKGGIGSILIFVLEKEGSFEIEDWEAVVVDGKTIKPNTWYKLENGKIVEAEE